MFTVIAQIETRPGRVTEFTEVVRANATASLRDEPGCLRFDVMSVEGTQNQFVLYETYTDERAYSVGHRGSPHYARWRAAVADLVPSGGLKVTMCSPLYEGSIGQ